MADAGEGAGKAGGERVCAGQDVELDEVREGQVREGALVKLEAVATSRKFLVSHAKSGSCLWGMFVGAEPDGEAPRGAFVVSFGREAGEDESCAPGTDGIPDQVSPGERVRVVGRYASYVPQSCAGVAAEAQIVVDAGCPIERDGVGEAPDPVLLSFATADALAAGSDTKLLGRYSGGLVALEGVNALAVEEGDGVVGPYGVVRFAETRLEAHNDVAYGDLSDGGPGAPEKGLVFPDPTRFERIVGLIHLDYCTWTLTIRDPCGDLAPPSRSCGG